MANADSERKPDVKERRARLSGTIYDLVLYLLALGTAGFALGVIVSAIEGHSYLLMVVFAILAFLSTYLYYYLRRNRRRPIGQDYYL